MNTKITVVIPFLNEEENISFLVQELDRFFAARDAYSAEVLFVDDGSTDGSVDLLARSHPQHFSARVIRLSRNFGSHAALRAGIRHATGEHIVFVYADLQDPLELIDRLYEESHKGNDICWASREQTSSGFAERTFSRLYSGMMRRYAVPTYPEKGFDVVMFNRKVQYVINEHVEANSSLFLQILTLGFRQSFISYTKGERKKGKSKWTLGKKIKLFIDSFVAFSYAPIRLVTITGITMFFLGMLWSSYLIIRKLVWDDLASGWPALISILMIGFGITNISLGIIAEYLWRTLDSSRKRPVFIIDEIVEVGAKEEAR